MKLEKRRLKQEKLKKITEERDKKKNKKMKNGGSPIISNHYSTLDNFVQSENNAIPLLLEKCIQFIETEGLDSEGLYRVPGNRSHVDLLFQRFEEGSKIVKIHNIVNCLIIILLFIMNFFSVNSRIYLYSICIY